MFYLKLEMIAMDPAQEFFLGTLNLVNLETENLCSFKMFHEMHFMCSKTNVWP